MNNCGLSLRGVCVFLRYNAMIVQVCGSQMMKFRFKNKKENYAAARERYTMVKIDLITGFLGSGKTTFIRKYAQYLMDAGNNIGILGE